MASASAWLLDQVNEAAKLLWSGSEDSKDIVKGLLRILAAAEIHADKHGAVSVPIRKLLQELPRRGGSGLSPFHCIRKLSTFRAVWGKFGTSLDINAKDKTERKTLLHHVARNIKHGNEYVKFLLECNAAPDSKDRYGWTPLHEAARTGNDSVLREVGFRLLDQHQLLFGCYLLNIII